MLSLQEVVAIVEEGEKPEQTSVCRFSKDERERGGPTKSNLQRHGSEYIL